MLARFCASIETQSLIPPGARVLLGYSGGADSTCLLHLMNLAGTDVVAAYLHHGQRPEADEELSKCAHMCERLGVPFVSGRADVPAIAKARGIGLEEAGREARYEFFRMSARQAECELIATAHTRTDHVETVLLNVVRGCGLAGLAGIPRRRGNIIRPLLKFSREETTAYCRDRGLWTHDDPANEDLAFSRARLRSRVAPELLAINPKFEDAVARLASLAEEEDAFLDAAAARALESSEAPLNGALRFLTLDCEAGFSLSQLLHLPDVLLRRALRLAAGALGGAWDFGQAMSLAGALRSRPNGSFTCEGGTVAASWEGGTLHFRDLSDLEPTRQLLTVPGSTPFEPLGWEITAEEAAPPASRVARDSLETLLDPGLIQGDLFLRAALPGDRMQPAGFQGTRKLADLMSEAKLTRAARRRLPIVCDMVGPVWAPGVCVSARVVWGSLAGSPKSGREQTVGTSKGVRRVSGGAIQLSLKPLDRCLGETRRDTHT